MGNSFPCWTKFKGTDLHEFLKKKTQFDDPLSSEGKDAYLKAAKDLQQENVNKLHDVYSQIGVKGFEKTAQPETNKEFNDFKNHILDHVANVPDNSFDFRVTTGLKQKEIEQAVRNIKEGKDTKAAQTLLASIKRMYDEGYVELNTSAGGLSQRMGIPIKEYMAEVNKPLKIEDLDELNTLLGEDAFRHNFEHYYDETTRTGSDQQTQEVAAGAAGQNIEKTSGGQGAPPTNPEVQQTAGEGNKIGVHHAALSNLAKELGLPEPERSQYITPEEHAERGRQLMNAGADVSEVDNKNNELHDRISLGRAYLEKDYNELNQLRKSKGANSQEYKDKLSDINNLSEKVKQLGSKAGQSMASLQGERDTDTDNFEVVKQNLQEKQGKPADAAQQKKIEQLTTQNETLKKRAEDAEAKLIEETNKRIGGAEEKPKSQKTISEKAKNTADRLRKAAKIHKPDSFSAATPASLVWDAAVETVAKSIEAGGEIAEAIQKGIKYVQGTDWYKSLSDDKKKEAEDDFISFHNENAPALNSTLESLWQRFANKSDNEFTPEESKAVWGYARNNYLDKGVGYKDMIQNVSGDTGLTWRQVSSAITPKSDKYLKSKSDEMWKARSDRMKSQQATKDWVAAQNANPALRAWLKISGAIRGEFVFGHGGIFLGTHASGTIFQPKLWKHVFPAFLKGWKFAYGNTGDYEREMAAFRSRPLYLKFQRLGLQNNVDNYNSEELQSSQKFLGKLSGAGIKGFNAIKVLRQDWAESEYNKLSEREKNDDASVQTILKLVNTGTRATNLKVHSVAREVMFAPGMELSRWAQLIKNPAQASGYSLKWLYNATTGKGEMTPSQKVFVKTWARRTGWSLGTFTGAILANAALQNTLNPKNPVNLTDPTKPDFLKMKFGDLTIDATGGLLSAINLVRGMVHIAGESKKELKGDNPFTAETKKVGGYLRGKIAPAYSIGADFLAKEDYNHEVMPFSSEKPAAGKHKMTWTEYGMKHLPLPLAETSQEIYNSALDNVGKDNRSTLEKVLTAATAGVISAATGIRTGEYNAELENTKRSPFTEDDKNAPEFKYFIDKGLELPNVSHSSINAPDNKNKTMGKLSDLPKETQDEYDKLHNQILKDELGSIIKRGYVHVSYGEVTAHEGKKTPLDELTKEQLADVLHSAQSDATRKTNKKLLPKKY